MTDTVDNLILDLVEWVGRRQHTYEELMQAWRTSCPRLTIWEDATDRGLVERIFAEGRALVRVTQAGFDLLERERPHSWQLMRRSPAAQPRREHASQRS